MTESTKGTPQDEPSAEEAFAWTADAPPSGDAKGTGTPTAEGFLESVREFVNELAERAGPMVRELSARAAELTAIAADRAAPLAKRAGEVTADASATLASKSREWASEIRASVATAPEEADSTADTGDPTSN